MKIGRRQGSESNCDEGRTVRQKDSRELRCWGNTWEAGAARKQREESHSSPGAVTLVGSKQDQCLNGFGRRVIDLI